VTFFLLIFHSEPKQIVGMTKIEVSKGNGIKSGWFYEESILWPGQRTGLEVEKVLLEVKSEFQEIMVFKSKKYGNVLVLDGAIQATERDEFAYQEMITHLAMCSHVHPKSVLVIGGGDGGVLREIEKHPSVERITICEIDKMVIQVAREYLPSMGIGFDDPRVTVHVGDGVEFMKGKHSEFDVIIVDSSDPVGPAEVLYTESFYRCMHDALTPNGVICTQAEYPFVQLDFVKGLVKMGKKVFKHCDYAVCSTPTFPTGLQGFLLASMADSSCRAPVRKIEAKMKYYNQEVHRSAFVLPEFMRAEIEQ